MPTTSTLGNAIVAWNPALTPSGIIGINYTVTDAGGSGFATILGGDVVRDTNYTVLTVTNSMPSTTTTDFTTTPTDNQDIVGVGYLGGTPAGQNSTGYTLTLTNANAHATNSLFIGSLNAGTSNTLDLGTQTMTFTAGGLAMVGAGNYTIQDGQLGDNNTALTVNQSGAGTLTISAAISSGSGSLIKIGGGKLILSGSNTYSGGTTFNGGQRLVRHRR